MQDVTVEPGEDVEQEGCNSWLVWVWQKFPIDKRLNHRVSSHPYPADG